MWPWPCVQGSKAADPRRREAEVNKANQRLALISNHSDSRLAGGHPRDRFPPSIPTRRNNAGQANEITPEAYKSQLRLSINLWAFSVRGTIY